MTKLRNVLAVAALIVLFAGFAQAQCTHCGFTPGFWKTHTEIWPAPYTPGTTLDSVFTGLPSAIGGQTLLDALDFPGGAGLDGAIRILMRSAVASVLNAVYTPATFNFTAADIIGAVNTTLASGDRSLIIAVAANLNDWNQDCP